MVTDQEKNDVLMRFAGLELRGGGWGIRAALQPFPAQVMWDFHNDLDLLHSLDAQAKWLNPKLMWIRVEIIKGQVYVKATLATGVPVEAEGEDEAETRAEAILSLIGNSDG